MITEIAHLRIGESAKIRGHLVARFSTGYEIDGGPALSFEDASTRVDALAPAPPTDTEERARAALAPYNLQLPADRAGLEKLAKSLRHYAGDEGRALVAVVEALIGAG